MLTDLDLHSYLGDDFLTPATIDEFTEDRSQSMSPASDEYSLFTSNNVSDNFKPTQDASVYTLESPDIMSSPTESAHSPDLLDLESVSYFLLNPEEERNWASSGYVTNGESLTNESTATNHPNQITKPTRKRKLHTAAEIELQIEIEESTKRAKRCTAPLTEEQKRLRRKELNRLAAQRCRSKRKSHGEILEEEIAELTEKNRQLRERLEELESTKNELYDVIKYHFASCHSK